MDVVGTNDRKRSDLILHIYEAPMEDILLDTSDFLRDIIGFDHSFTGFNDLASKSGNTFNYRSHDTSQDILDEYVRYYQSIDYISWCYNECIPRVFRSTDLVTLQAIENSRLHREWESRMGTLYTAEMCVAHAGLLYGTICLMRSEEHGDFNDEEMRILDDVNKHLCNRFKLAYPNGVNRMMMDRSTDPIAAAFRFTEREWEIVCMILRGSTRAQIADQLCISKNTLKRHVANIYAKVGVSSEGQLLAALSKAHTGQR